MPNNEWETDFRGIREEKWNTAHEDPNEYVPERIAHVPTGGSYLVRIQTN